MTDETPAPERAERRRRTALWWLLVTAAVLVGLLFGVFAVGRYGLISKPGREFVLTLVQGKKVGRFGTLDVYGLKGDLWNDFTLERVAVSDAKGVWLEAKNVRVDWSWTPLIGRRFHAELISAEVLRLIRRPELEPQLEPPSPMPLSIDIDRFEGQIELLPEFSKEYGRWTIAGEADIDREGAKAVKLDARSVSRPGDFVTADVSIGGRGDLKDTLKVDVQAVESKGGPIAGSLGYSPDLPFTLKARIGGATKDGRVEALLKSGAFTPLLVDGRWDDGGALIGGRMVFAGSDLFAPFARRLGDEVKFGLAGRQRAADRFAVAWEARAPNLTARSFGVFEPKGRTAPDGVRLDVATGSISRLIGHDLAGAGRIKGVWNGDPTAWRFTGDTSVEQFTAVGYRLGKAAGPIEIAWKAGRWDVKTKLTGTGGMGNGVLPRLFGPRPRADIELARLKDGRFLLTRVDATGAGLKIKGSGARGLTGTLTFQGQATLTDPSTIRKGAKGEIVADFKGNRPHGVNRWNVTADARGRRFATGLSQFDRLMGTEPRLKATGALVNNVIEIDRGRLEGKAAQADGKGAMGLNGSLNLALDWSAKGPFQAGPVEIAGQAKGTGNLTGNLGAPRIDLKARLQQIDTPVITLTDAMVDLTFQSDPRGSDGRIGVVGGSAYGPVRAASAFQFVPGGVTLRDLNVDGAGVQAKGGLALRNSAPSAADLTFAAGPGVFLASGKLAGTVRLTDGPGTAAAVLDVSGTDVRPRGATWALRTLSLKGTGTLARLPFTVTADVAGPNPGRFNGTGLYSRAGQSQSVSLSGDGALRGVKFNTLAPAVVTLDPDGRSLKLDVGVGGGRLTADASQAGENVDARAEVAGVQLNALSDRFEGKLTGSLDLHGRGDQLGGSLDARLEDARSLDGPRKLAVDATVKAKLTDRSLAIDASAFDEGGVRADTSLVLPVEASARPLHLAIVRDKPMNGRFSAAGEIQPIWDLLLGGDRRLSGQISAEGSLAGTLNAPKVQGYANLEGGRFEDFATGLKLTALDMKTRFDQGGAVVESFTAADGGRGTVTGDGRLDLRAGGASSFTVSLRNFRIIDNDLADARATGPLTVTRAADGKLALVGDLAVQEAEISATRVGGRGGGVVKMDVIEINKPFGEQQMIQPRAPGPSVALDVTLKADNRVFVRGRGLDVELALDAHVGGTVAQPELKGLATVVRGDWEFAGARFVFDEGGTVGLSTNLAAIDLNLRAVREDPSLTAIVEIRGTAQEPEVKLTSEPALPQDEILSQVLFGRSASQLSPLEAAQLASALASMAGGGGLDVFGNLREFAGLDRLTFGGGDQSGMTVAGGKYVTEDIYLEIIGGGVEGSAVEAEWRARRNLSIVSRIAATGAATLSIRWRKESR
ncbi:translocation/assembly module TamB domain-containing protein [Caulobacter sp. 17J65-9]|uniref:translocation/assembly module TamB domain-containing protein n=1 Tax=Caulobacter sp. 17J65-9 TaxID=2709382 RepID=UPI0013C794E6|nr:translocation/assembly module TamB domain-containing protein [Caulobacter sp. 17J65-9]NEX91983.1 hypothetical protein [Caulobacter sp. 17J65-9]